MLERGVRTSRRRVARLMIQQGIRGVCRRRRTGERKSTGKVVLALDQVRRAFRAESNVKLSMGSVGDCYDNAMAESLFATLETELIDRQPRQRFRSRVEASREIFCYLEGFYNPRRIHSALNYRSPVAYERR